MNRLKKLLGVVGVVLVFFLNGFVLAGEPMRTLIGHSKNKYVNSVAFSPDGTIIISGSDDDTVKLWDAQNGALLRTIKGHKRGVNSVAFSSDGTMIISGDGYGDLRLWDAQNGTLLRIFQGHEYAITSVAFSPDGSKIVSGSSDKTLILWDAQNGEPLFTKNHWYEVKSVAFSPDGTMIASGGSSTSLKLWDAQNGKLLHKEQDGIGSTNVSFSPDSTIIASGKQNGSIYLLYTQNRTSFRNIGSKGGNFSMVLFSLDGTMIASVNRNDFKLWDMQNGKLLISLKRDQLSKSTRSVAFSPDGTMIVLGGRNGTIKLLDISSYSESLANKVYKSIDKSNYITLYEFTKKFYNKYDIVKQAYNDIYKAVRKKDTLDSYEWYQAYPGDNTVKEIGTIKKRLNTLRQEKYTKEYKSVKEENNLAVYEYYANTHSRPKADKLEDAISNMHKLAFEKAKDIDTISSYNTFIYAYPFSDEIEEANRLAYELEKDKYTDIGMMSFLGKNEKMNKQARSLLIEAQNIIDIVLDKERNTSIINTGYYMVVNRMYDLAKNEFADTDRVLTLRESPALKKFDKILQQKLQERKGNIKKIKSGPIEDTIELRVDSTKAVMSYGSSDSNMKKFYSSERKNAKQFIESLKKIHLKKRDERLNKIKVKVANFEKLYQKVLSEYKTESKKVRRSTIEKAASRSQSQNRVVQEQEETGSKSVSGNDSINSNSNFPPEQKVQQQTQSHISTSNQLTDDERQELEQLRAEKAKKAREKQANSVVGYNPVSKFETTAVERAASEIVTKKPVNQSQTSNNSSFKKTREDTHTDSSTIYYARISQRDHYGARNQKLKDVGTILQQDRANYHKYQKRDREDTGDNRFDTRGNRNKIKRMLARGATSQKTLDAIRYGTPLVKVKIYPEYIDVTLESRGGKVQQKQQKMNSAHPRQNKSKKSKCNTDGSIKGISSRGDGFVAVRKGPGTKYGMIGKIYRNGTRVQVCERKGKWKGVIYGDCILGSSRSRNGSCKAGWIYEKYIRIR